MNTSRNIIQPHFQLLCSCNICTLTTQEINCHERRGKFSTLNFSHVSTSSTKLEVVRREDREKLQKKLKKNNYKQTRQTYEALISLTKAMSTPYRIAYAPTPKPYRIGLLFTKGSLISARFLQRSDAAPLRY